MLSILSPCLRFLDLKQLYNTCITMPSQINPLKYVEIKYRVTHRVTLY
nr:MAG TPA: hypothetical protein [Caudoviricetes sp.]